jgi:hypothetical protein
MAASRKSRFTRSKRTKLGSHVNARRTELAAYTMQMGGVAIDTARYVAHTPCGFFDLVASPRTAQSKRWM